MNGLTLESAEEAFRQWRDQRRSRVDAIPEILWSMALGLYPQYKRSKICRILRLSGGQFKERLEAGPHSFPSTGFVLASNKEVVKATPIPSPEIQLTLQGQARSMTLCFDMHELGQVLAHVTALL
jgi:hypothetical protein